jgi:hypothetical protein
LTCGWQRRVIARDFIAKLADLHLHAAPVAGEQVGLESVRCGERGRRKSPHPRFKEVVVRLTVATSMSLST